MGFIKKEIAIGFLVSLLSTCSALFIYTEYVTATLKTMQQVGILGTVISLATIPNLLIFFIFLKKKQDYRAKGVLMATFFTALVTFIIKFI
ncbi:MAG: hypothetical protein KGV59_05895 [Tenacibaculum sp.]|nr:hypothetical protein [Tenacibaculum sp.]